MVLRFKWFLVAGSVPLPWIALRFLGVHADPLLVVLLTGAAIMSAAFILTWAAEAAESDVAGPIMIMTLALVAVLPEYAVDGTFAWKAGQDLAFAPYAVANMTGANRLLIGIGWSTIVFLFVLCYNIITLEVWMALFLILLLLILHVLIPICTGRING